MDSQTEGPVASNAARLPCGAAGALPKILDVLRETRVFVAALSDGQDVLKRVEGALGRYYKQGPDLQNCLVPGQRVPGLRPIEGL